MKAKRKAINGIKYLFSLFNLLIEKQTALNSEKKILQYLLKKFEITYIVDVGANIGQFAEIVYKSGYKGRMFSFEPLPEIYNLLKQKAAKHHQLK